MQLLGIAFALVSVVAGEELLQKMYDNHDGFFVVPAASCSHARDACARNGGRLADITTENVLKASRVAISRNGPYTSSWVAGCDGGICDDACLALSVGSSGAGTLSVLPGRQSHMMALCRRVADYDRRRHKKCRKTKVFTRTVRVLDPTTLTVLVTAPSISTSISTSLLLTTSSDFTTLTLTTTTTTISTDGTSETIVLTSTTTSTDPTTITSTTLTATTSTTTDTSTIFSTDSTTLTDTATTTSIRTSLTTIRTTTTTTFTFIDPVKRAD